ncbi:MAG: hypothetical protein SNJ57_10070 [Cyanobacteriota bacterium]
MPAVRGLDPITGLPVWIDAVSGDGSELTPFVMRRADPDAHSRLDAIATNTNNTHQALTTSWSFDSFVTTQAHRIVKASGGKLYSFTFHNRSATPYWLMLFNQTAAPSANATNFLLMPIPVFPSTMLSLGRDTFGQGGVNFSTGIVYGFSSNADQYVAIASPTDLRAFVGFL